MMNRRLRLIQMSVLTLGCMSLVVTSGCTFGIRKETKVIYGNIAAPVAKGAIRIATNDDIEVSVVGSDESFTTMDLGGYYVVSPGDMKLFVRLLKNENP